MQLSHPDAPKITQLFIQIYTSVIKWRENFPFNIKDTKKDKNKVIS